MTRSLRKATLCSTLAIATSLVLGAKPASAQFIGSVINETGAHAHTLGNGELVVNVTSPQAVINWSATGAPSSGLVTFQQSGALVTFQGNGEFAILNRVFPTATGNGIYMNGQIMTSINGQSGGGTVFFYSPNGIVIGQNALIDVGSLGLTTSMINDDGDGNWLTGFGGTSHTVTYTGAIKDSYVRVDSGAMINALGVGNYVAIVAPRVDHFGTIRTDGVAALVGAEAATLTIRESGLWDIVVNTGTEDGQGVNLSGTVSRYNAAVGYDHKAYVVAVPKNDAVTMLFGPTTNLGFEVAGSVGVENNVVVLSAGNNVYNGVAAGGGSGTSAIGMNGATVTSHLNASATGTVDVNSDGGAVNFARNATLTGGQVNLRATNHALTVGGNLLVTTNRTGAVGQNVKAGNVTIQASNAKTLNIKGSATINAIGTGGMAADDGLTAGRGEGGNVVIQAVDGGTVDFDGLLTVKAEGFGGLQPYSGGAGGEGKGGELRILANNGNSKVIVGGQAALSVEGEGGTYEECSECSVAGGVGRGGLMHINGAYGSGNSLSFGSGLTMHASGFGGVGDAGGGAGYGGEANLGSADGAVVTVAGVMYNFSDGIGGNGMLGASGGAGYGGNASLNGFWGAGGSIALNSTLDNYVTAEGYGGDGSTSGGNGGFAQGGTAYVGTNGASISSAGTLFVRAWARGGHSYAGTGGSALAGTSYVDVTGQSLTVNGQLILHSFARGGQGVTAGGNATANDAAITVSAGTLNVTGNTFVDAYALGGVATGAGGIGGHATGDYAGLNFSGGTLTIGGATNLRGYGTGGAAASGHGGDGTGGNSNLNVNGGALTMGTLTLDARGTGAAGGLSGGDGIGGWSHIYGSAGTANFTSAVTVNITAGGTGGSSTGGAGGNATGGRARVNADGADYHFFGGLTLLSSAVGGNGVTGGNATARAVGQDNNSFIMANRGGSVTVDGSTFIGDNANGGAGSNGAGGNATGGRVTVQALSGPDGNGTIDLGTTTLRAFGFGGAGGAGGAGGSGTGGLIGVATYNNNFGSNALTIDTLFADVWGIGGAGGAGLNGSTGGAGGAGAFGKGGYLQVTGTSGNGQLDIGTLTYNISGTGGAGGNGGTGSAGVGGAGGAGGIGEGGEALVGLLSGIDTPTTSGWAQFDSINGNANSVGGSGGNGGSGTSGAGNGGDGGQAWASEQRIIQRGGTMTLGSVDLTGNSTGGNGGSGVIAGRGGDAWTSNLFVMATNRFEKPTARADLTVGNYTANSLANGGTGSIAGSRIALGGHQLLVENGDADFTSYAVNVQAGDAIDPTSYADPIRIRNGTVTVTNGFSVTTDNRMSVALDNATLTAGSVTLDAADFEYDLTWSPAANRGTISAGTIGITSAKDIILDAKLVSGGGLTLNASGLVDLGNLTATGNILVDAGTTIKLGNISSGGWTQLGAGGNIQTGTIGSGGYIDIWSNLGAISTGNLTAAGSILAYAGTTAALGDLTSNDGFIDIDADGAITAGAVQAANEIDIESYDGAVTLTTLVGGVPTAANLSAGGDIHIDGDGAIAFGNATSGGTIDVEGGSSVTAGNLTAGISIFADAEGAITFNNLSAGLVNPGGPTEQGFSVGITSATSINVGNVAGAESVGFATLGGLTAGSITAGADVLAMVSGDMIFGPISAGPGGRIYLADSSMFIDAGGGGDEGEGGDEFDPELVFAAAPVATNGSITVNGPITGGSLQASAGSNFTAPSIDVSGLLLVEAGGNISVGTIQSGLSVAFDAGNLDVDTIGSILVGDVTSSGSISFTASGSVNGDAFSAADNLTIAGATGVDVGDLSSGGFTSLWSNGAIETGEILAGNFVAIESAGGSVQTDDIESQASVDVDAATSLTTGSIDAGRSVRLVAGGAVSTDHITAGAPLELGFSESESAPADLAINAGGPITTLNLQASNHVLLAATGAISTGTIDAGDSAVVLGGANIGLGAVNAGELFYVGGTAIQQSAGIIGDDFSIDALDLGQTNASGGTLTITGATSAGEVSIYAQGKVRAGAIDSVGPTFVGSFGDIAVGNVVSGGYASLQAGGALSAGSVDAGDYLSLGAGTTLTALALTAGGSVDLTAGGAISAGNILANQAVYELAGEGIGTFGHGGDGVTIWSDASVTTGSITTDYDIEVDAGTTITTGALTAGGFADLNAGTGISVNGATNAGSYVEFESDSGPIAMGAIRADEWVDIETEGTVNGTTISVGSDLSVWGAQGVTLTNLDAGIVNPVSSEGGSYVIGIGSAQNVTLGTVNGASDVGFAAGGNLTVGNITAAGRVLALVSGNASFGAISAGSRVALAGFGMLELGEGEEDFDPQPIFAAIDAGNGTAIGGSVQISGPVGASRFDALVTGNLTTAAISAPTLNARVGGMATVNGQWNATTASLWSNDINIGSSGGIAATTLGIRSTNPNQMVIGGSPVTTAYLLDGAEFARIVSPNLTLTGRADAAAPIDMVIGDSALNGAGTVAASTTFQLISGNEVGGVMRVVGNVLGTGFAANDSLSFRAGRIEVDAATGTIALANGGALGGDLRFYTPRLHVAEAALLDKLALDPADPGRALALQTAPGVARPDGVVRAAAINVYLTGAAQQPGAVGAQSATPYSVFVQNTGALDPRAGFVAGIAEVHNPQGGSAGAIDLIVNGQLVTPDGTLTGRDVRDALMEEDDPARFTATSTINGCGVSGGGCAALKPPPPPTIYDPGPPVADQIVLFNDVSASEEVFGNEETIEDNQEEGGEDSATSPIEPPNPLFDTRPLASEDETDEPISGGGNPALIGSGVETDGETEEEKKRKRKSQQKKEQK